MKMYPYLDNYENSELYYDPIETFNFTGLGSYLL